MVPIIFALVPTIIGAGRASFSVSIHDLGVSGSNANWFE